VGNAVVDLGGLEAGLGELCGWYHILDARGVRQGQLKVRACCSAVMRVLEASATPLYLL
jgi:hypothetical protein